MTSRTVAQRRPLLLSVLFMFLITLITGGTGVYVLMDPGLGESLQMVRTALLINQLYEHEVDWDQLVEDGLRGMFDRLDRYSGYVEPRRWDRMHEELSGSYTGIGVSVTQHDSGLMIMSVRENGPAAAAGIMSGDIVLRVDSTNLFGLGIYESTDHLRGPEGSKVQLGLYRPADEDTLSVTVVRRKIDFVHIPFAGFTPDSAIYIRLLDFDAGASEQLEAALDSLLEQAVNPPPGIILDLRGNPGGLFSEAYRTANLFLDGGEFIVGTDGRSRWGNERHESTGDDITGGLPLAIIVDGGSASSSEIVAGALSQLGRAALIGDTTFGKGLVQGYRRLHDGSGVRLTISRYYLEGRLYLNEFDSMLNETGSGLVPDYLIEMPEDDDFVRALERSRTLIEFAGRHEDDIVAVAEQFSLDDQWVDRFAAFARDEGFDYESESTERAEVLAEQAINLPASDALIDLAEKTLARSRRIDSAQFLRHGDYVKRRLAEIALERRYGAYTAYRKAIVPARTDIKLATQVLREMR